MDLIRLNQPQKDETNSIDYTDPEYEHTVLDTLMIGAAHKQPGFVKHDIFKNRISMFPNNILNNT